MDASQEATCLTLMILYCGAGLHYSYYENINVIVIVAFMTATYFAMRVFILSLKRCLMCGYKMVELQSEQCDCKRIRATPLPILNTKPKNMPDVERDLAMEHRRSLQPDLTKSYGFGYAPAISQFISDTTSKNDNPISSDVENHFFKIQHV